MFILDWGLYLQYSTAISLSGFSVCRLKQLKKTNGFEDISEKYYRILEILNYEVVQGFQCKLWTFLLPALCEVGFTLNVSEGHVILQGFI